VVRAGKTHQLLLQPIELGLAALELGGVRRSDRGRYAREFDLELREKLVGLVKVGRNLAEECPEGLWPWGRRRSKWRR
jgi:hypothetical protein